MSGVCEMGMEGDGVLGRVPSSIFGREFVAGGFSGMAGVISGYPLDTLRIRLQQPTNTPTSALALLRTIVASQGLSALYRGMGAPLASITFQNAMVFQLHGLLSRAFESSLNQSDPPSFRSVALGGVGTGALQSLMLSPVELVKIRLQLRTEGNLHHLGNHHHEGPVSVAKSILKREGLRGIYRGLTITVLRDAPSYGVYFLTYEYMREQLHPGCRKSRQESPTIMLVSGGMAGVASWVSCYPLDVVKSRLQSQTQFDNPPPKYHGILDCFRKSVQEEGYSILCRGLGTAVSRAFIVNGAVFTAYEIVLRCLFTNNNGTNPTEGKDCRGN